MTRILLIIFFTFFVYKILKDIRKNLFKNKQEVRSTKKKKTGNLDRDRIEDAKFTEIKGNESSDNH